jgi:segregation and condensation protein B
MIDRLKDLIEALIFISIEPLGAERLKLILQEFPPAEIDRALDGLLRDQEAGRGGVRVQMTAGGYVFATRPEFDVWVRRLLSIERKTKLSMAALETLSTVAYHQPITQAEISALRGVDASYTLHSLLHKKLIRIAGRKKAPGSPLLYRTTDKFLEYFGLNSLEDLPREEEISKLLEPDRLEPVEEEALAGGAAPAAADEPVAGPAPAEALPSSAAPESSEEAGAADEEAAPAETAAEPPAGEPPGPGAADETP